MTIVRFLPYRFEKCGCNRCLDAHKGKRPLYVVRVIKGQTGLDSKAYILGRHVKIESEKCYEVYNAIVEHLGDVCKGLPDGVDTIDVRYPEQN
jgi:hypothetical protein